MAVVSALPQRLDIQVIAGDAFSFNAVIGQNITGQSVSATLHYYTPTFVSGFDATPSTAPLGVVVTNAATGAVTVSLSGAETSLAVIKSKTDTGCLPHWTLASPSKTYIAGTVLAASVSGCSIGSSTTSQASSGSSGGVFL
jgi:hypothetical protein